MNERVSAGQADLSGDDIKALEKLSQAYKDVRNELGKVIVGQNEVIEQLMISIFAKGHCLLEGVPGLAKTLMVSTLARTLNLEFSRIQFTPDLMPSDIIGTEVIQEDKSSGARVQVSQRAGICQHHPGGRDQSDPSQNASRIAGGDAGKTSDDRR